MVRRAGEGGGGARDDDAGTCSGSDGGEEVYDPGLDGTKMEEGAGSISVDTGTGGGGSEDGSDGGEGRVVIGVIGIIGGEMASVSTM